MTSPSIATKHIENQSGLKWILTILTTLISGYGIYAAIHRNFIDYLFLKNQFVFFDQSKPVIWFILDYMMIMGLFVTLGHYAAKIFKSTNRA